MVPGDRKRLKTKGNLPAKFFDEYIDIFKENNPRILKSMIYLWSVEDEFDETSSSFDDNGSQDEDNTVESDELESSTKIN